jgi:hypothetical protein
MQQCGKVNKHRKKLLRNLVGHGKRAIPLRSDCDSKQRVLADMEGKMIKVPALLEFFSWKED